MAKAISKKNVEIGMDGDAYYSEHDVTFYGSDVPGKILHRTVQFPLDETMSTDDISNALDAAICKIAAENGFTVNSGEVIQPGIRKAKEITADKLLDGLVEKGILTSKEVIISVEEIKP